MARMTQEQKLLVVQQAAELEAAEEARFKDGLPKRIFEIYALAQNLEISCFVKLEETGPCLCFDHDDERNHLYLDEKLTYKSSQYEVEFVESKLATEKQRKDQIEAEKNTARAAWDTLSAEQQRCLKEHIVWMRHK